MDLCHFSSNMDRSYVLDLSYFLSARGHDSVQNLSDVSMNLAKHVFFSNFKGNESDPNMVCSPLSIQIILGLIAAGAKGPTLDQLLCFLKFNSIEELNYLFSRVVEDVFADGSSRGGPRLSVANGAWISQTLSFKHSFKHVLETVYKATSKSVDFQNKAVEVVDEVNRWAKEKTNGLIENILSRYDVNAFTSLIFANALYFKGAWVHKFNASYTKDQEFHLFDGSSVQAPLMTSHRRFDIEAAVYDGFKVLVLPYKSGNDRRRFNMYFILPNAYNGLPNLLEKITSEPGFMSRCIPTKTMKVNKLVIPKFKITYGFEASNVLKQLGLTLHDGFTEMVDDDYPIPISKILHKSFIEVNEEGTEAAAVTVITMFGSSRMTTKLEEIEFVADHPFLFLIKDDATGVVLLVGTVLNPLLV